MRIFLILLVITTSSGAFGGEYGYIQNGVTVVLSKDGRTDAHFSGNSLNGEGKKIYYQRFELGKTKMICFYLEKAQSNVPYDPTALTCSKE